MPLTFDMWQRFDSMARERSMRLPVIALQQMMRRDEAHQPTSLSESLCDETQWRTRLNRLAYKGISEGDIEHWLWILSGQDPDERIERFVSVDRPKPIFLLLQLLQRDQTFYKGTSLASIYAYVDLHHVRSRAIAPDTALPFGAMRRTLDSGLNMEPQRFAMLLRLLVYHYLRLWPSALPAVARLVVAYVETVQQKARTRARAYADSCALFNEALVLFQHKSPINPVFQMRYNWRAQKILLAMSTAMPRPLLISRPGFRAIRRVMLALGKSPAERKVAMRMVRTWPPYRRDWDGLDEKKQPADDFSRSVKAGLLMHEAGYAEMEHDRALSVLGGAVPGDGPTVQTRSLSPRTWTGSRASMNVYSTWAARVKATRDVNEAWHEFQTAPVDGMRPSVQVYAEMFKKLVATPVDANAPSGKTVLPGDGREVFPVNDATLTAFEKQRLKPPSLDALYADMLRDGSRPVGDCLSVLVQHAPTMQAAMRYLHDSPLDRKAIAALKLPYVTQSTVLAAASPAGHLAGSVTLDLLRQIPLANLTAYVFLMCRFQPRITAEPARLGKLRRVGLIHHAIGLCARRLPLAREDGRTYKAPWHTIMRTLAQPKVLISTHRTQDRRFQDTECLALALRVFAKVHKTCGIDPVLFESLCRTVQKCLRWAELATHNAGNAASEKGDSEAADLDRLLRKAHAALVLAFEEMTMLSSLPPDGAVEHHHPAAPHNITARDLQGYMQVLGYLGDAEAMVRTVRWVLRMWDDEVVLEDAKDMDDGQHGTLVRVLVLFRAFAETQVADAGVLAQLEAELQRLQRTQLCTWRWPTAEDADEYVRWHRQPHTAAFWGRVRPGA